jgi:hypothetical protein
MKGTMQERRSSSWGAPWWPPPRTLQTASKASVISSMTSAGRPEEDDVTEGVEESVLRRR